MPCPSVKTKSDTHRSLWFYVKHPTLFDRAGDVDHFERQSAYAQQHDLGVRQVPDTSQVALAALRADMSARRVASFNA